MIKYILPIFLFCVLVGTPDAYAQKKGRGARKATTSSSAKVAKTATSQDQTVVPENTTTSALPSTSVEPTEKEQNKGEDAAQVTVTTEVAAQVVAEQPKEGAEPKETVQANASATQEPLAQGAAAEEGEGFVVQREEAPQKKENVVAPRVVFNPKSQRDPTLSPDDLLILAHREKMRLAAIEAEKQRKLAEERRKREEAERQRLLELERLKDPTKEVRSKIRVSGVIGQEVFIGSKIYTIGNSIYGARIVEVNPDYVIFSYKGHKFRRNVQL